MSTSPADDVFQYLVSIGLIQDSSTDDWSGFISLMPNEPDRAVALFNLGGSGFNPKLNLEESSVKINVRGKQGEYTTVYDKIFKISDALTGLGNYVIGSNMIIGVWQTGSISLVLRDNKERNILSSSFRIVRKPLLTTYSHRNQ